MFFLTVPDIFFIIIPWNFTNVQCWVSDSSHIWQVPKWRHWTTSITLTDLSITASKVGHIFSANVSSDLRPVPIILSVYTLCSMDMPHSDIDYLSLQMFQNPIQCKIVPYQMGFVGIFPWKVLIKLTELLSSVKYCMYYSIHFSWVQNAITRHISLIFYTHR